MHPWKDERRLRLPAIAIPDGAMIPDGHRKADFDVVIIGAGAAGIGAGLAARALGLSYVVLEAMPRIGGRALTDSTTFGAPWDAGCFILHSASENPLARVAERIGIRVQKNLVRRPRLLRADGWACDEDALALLEHYEDCWELVRAAGQAGRDVAIGDVVDRTHALWPQFGHRCAIFQGVDPEDGSTLDYVRYRDLHENWPVADGYGTLMTRIAAGLDIRLNMPVARIDHGAVPLRLDTAAGSLRARACVLTASTNVLAAEMIRFDPPLDDAKHRAIESVPTGIADKIVFGFPPGALPAEPNDYMHVVTGSCRTLGFHLRPFGYDYASAYVAGSTAIELEEEGEEAACAFAMEKLVAAFGSGIAAKVTARRATRWGKEPWIRGAYSAARPGAALARLILAEPVSERLHLAGEATAPDFFSTAHGAYLSGVHTVQRIARQLGRNAPPLDPVALALPGGATSQKAAQIDPIG